MDNSYKNLIRNNVIWVKQMKEIDPAYFNKLAEIQKPDYLWIGCSDSRVPANTITGTNPGEVFVHRNIANMVIHSDMNMLSVLSFAVEVLKVKHIIVCGHFGCGGVTAAMENKQYGLIDNWLRHIKDVYNIYSEKLEKIENLQERLNMLVKLNVQEQAYNLGKTTIVQNAWERGQILEIHGWVYDIHDGIIQDLKVDLTSSNDLQKVFRI
ncbi:MAG: carbonate dehydratase [Sediminibacterium sp.]|nr:carbonate dehydratase [Sediminibacterium sp.]